MVKTWGKELQAYSEAEDATCDSIPTLSYCRSIGLPNPYSRPLTSFDSLTTYSTSYVSRYSYYRLSSCPDQEPVPA